MIVILGYGEQAKAICKYIYEQSDEEILIKDKENKIINPEYKNRCRFEVEPIGHIGNLILKLPKGNQTTIINCLPTEYILFATEDAIKNGNNIIDLAGETKIEREQLKLNEKAVNSNSVVIRAAGIAPGIVSSFVKYFEKLVDPIGIRIFCGGVPKYPEYPLGYVRVFNESGVIKEYSGTADEIRDGKLVKVPALSEREHIFIPSLGIMEADITTGAISTTLENLSTGLEYFSYKTLRYPGHYDYVKRNILNQKNPEEVLSNIIEPVSSDNPDIIVLRIEVETADDIFEREYFWEYDYDNNISAMAQATGYIAAEVALQIKTKAPGVHNMDIFDPYNIRNAVRTVKDEGNFSEAALIF